MTTPIAAGPLDRRVGRLSEKQRYLLLAIAASQTPHHEFPNGLPLYVSCTFMANKFDTESERQRFIANLAKRGFLTMSGADNCLLSLTDTGRAAIKTPNDRVEGRDAASSRRVPSHDGLGVAVPSAPTFDQGENDDRD